MQVIGMSFQYPSVQSMMQKIGFFSSHILKICSGFQTKKRGCARFKLENGASKAKQKATSYF